MKPIQSQLIGVALLFFLHGVHGVAGEPMRIVSPSFYADKEAPSTMTSSCRDGRIQQVFPASDFASLPKGYHTITEYAWRPDGALNQPLTITVDHQIVRLSTTPIDPPNLSLTFADNIGPDETVVFETGPGSWSTANIGPPGGPKDFDFIQVLDTPFEYDPSKGNLLLDITWFGLSNPISYDHLGFSSEQVQDIGVCDDPDLPTATFVSSGVMVQFTFVPEPMLGDVNGDGEVDGLDVVPFVDVLLNGPYQTEADMNDDHVVNGLDVDPFVAAVVGGVQQIPEPSTLLLALVALCVVGRWLK